MIGLKLNLQLFAGEKTEKATPRRREEARKKGQVVKSGELTTVLVLTLTLFALKSWIPVIFEDFQAFFEHVLLYAASDLTLKKSIELLKEIILVLVKMVGPLLLTALLAGCLANVMQIGFLFTTETLKFDANRINPINGLKRIFSKRSIIELLKSIIKTLLVGYFAFGFLYSQLPGLSILMDTPLDTALVYLGGIFSTAIWRIIIVLFLLAIADYAYQIYEHEQNLKMSKQEIKEEYKRIEGDPLLKSKIRERQRQLASRRMMQDVPKATVIITNPTHVAVAVRYEEEKGAPEVVAKGQDILAQKIKEIALANQVIVMENKPLAWLLYKKVEIGSAIPADLYQAVAEVIAHVYRLKKRK